jgi:hypothetical protein
MMTLLLSIPRAGLADDSLSILLKEADAAAIGSSLLLTIAFNSLRVALLGI